MDPPPVQYVTTSDGYSIAYAVSGSGSGQPMIFMPSFFDHVQLAWEYPGLDSWLEGLAARFRLIQFDLRGGGMSTRGLAETHSTDDYQRDLAAVEERLKLDTFVLYAVAVPGCHVAVQYAVEHPERVSALVLGGVALTQFSFKSPALWQVLVREDWELYWYNMVPHDRTPEETRRRIDMGMQAFDQHDYVLRVRAGTESSELMALLPQLRVPALVLHPRDFVLLESQEAMKVAQLAGARMVLLDGSNTIGDAEQGIRAIESFLADIADTKPTPGHALGGLTARELEVIRLVTAGKSNYQIAEELVISVNTVASHVANILSKTGASNRTEAAEYARLHGLR